MPPGTTRRQRPECARAFPDVTRIGSAGDEHLVDGYQLGSQFYYCGQRREHLGGRGFDPVSIPWRARQQSFLL